MKTNPSIPPASFPAPRRRTAIPSRRRSPAVQDLLLVEFSHIGLRPVAGQVREGMAGLHGYGDGCLDSAPSPPPTTSGPPSGTCWWWIRPAPCPSWPPGYGDGCLDSAPGSGDDAGTGLGGGGEEAVLIDGPQLGVHGPGHVRRADLQIRVVVGGGDGQLGGPARHHVDGGAAGGQDGHGAGRIHHQHVPLGGPLVIGGGDGCRSGEVRGGEYRGLRGPAHRLYGPHRR